MRQSEIKIGLTYMFVGSEAPTRKHLAGQPFTVTDIKPVWRRHQGKSKLAKRFFNSDGVGARADELEPMNEIEQDPCPL